MEKAVVNADGQGSVRTALIRQVMVYGGDARTDLGLRIFFRNAEQNGAAQVVGNFMSGILLSRSGLCSGSVSQSVPCGPEYTHSDCVDPEVHGRIG